jgi:hypothetical protein
MSRWAMTASVTLRWTRGGLTGFPPVLFPLPSGYGAGTTCFHGEWNVGAKVWCRFTIQGSNG